MVLGLPGGIVAKSSGHIDIGSPVIARPFSTPQGRTVIDTYNPANLSGWITSIAIWAATNMTGLRVGIFFLVSGSIYQCRSAVAIGNVTAGAKRTYGGFALEVQAGDFIGFYFATGSIEHSDITGFFYKWIIGDETQPGDQATYAQTQRRVSLYGQGRQ